MHLHDVTDEDHLDISILLDTAFGKPTMYRFAKRLRDEGVLSMEKIAREGDTVVGYIACAKMVAPADVWSIAVLAVSPAHHKKGMGHEILARSVRHARMAGAKAFVVVGDPGYFDRAGFSRRTVEGLDLPFAADFTSGMLTTPGPNPLKGPLVYPAAYEHFDHQEVV